MLAEMIAAVPHLFVDYSENIVVCGLGGVQEFIEGLTVQLSLFTAVLVHNLQVGFVVSLQGVQRQIKEVLEHLVPTVPSDKLDLL
jgi:hypothetical protein